MVIGIKMCFETGEIVLLTDHQQNTLGINGQIKIVY